MPKTIKEVFNFGRIHVVFPAIKADNPPLDMFGDNVVIDGDTDEIIKWLKPFDGIAVGNGVPMTEQFTIMHINENL